MPSAAVSTHRYAPPIFTLTNGLLGSRLQSFLSCFSLAPAMPLIAMLLQLLYNTNRRGTPAVEYNGLAR